MCLSWDGVTMNQKEIKLSEMARNHFLNGGTIENWNKQVKLMELENESN